ncbi:MAG: Omp28-related outer membrane protein [Sphingobacteriales bacterium]|nr:MAG: Omp28-related outer membrane protein [Sphingobacteriales bacterium]
MKKLLLALALLPAADLWAQQKVTKKVILEDFTGEWCGYCPEGQLYAEDIKAKEPLNFLPLANHNGDKYEIPDGAEIDTKLDITGYPGGDIDRTLMPGETDMGTNRSSWQSHVNYRLKTEAIASVGFNNKHYNPQSKEYSADINVRFVKGTDGFNPINIQVYIVEDSILSQGQHNYIDEIGAKPTLKDWYHMNVLREAVGGAWGFAGVVPDIAVAGTTYTKNVSFKLDPSWNEKHIKIYAFVAYNGYSSAEKEILNSEEVSLKTFFPTGITTVKNPLAIERVYPNPATTSDVIKVEYNTIESANVIMNVMDVTGKVVATPYQSTDVAGSHTIQWRAADAGLASGIYIMQLSTGKNTFTQKINIQ